MARLLLKTHYQAARPGLFSILISRCASPHESRPRSSLARRLQENWPPSDRSSSGSSGKRKAGANSLVYLAERSFHFLTESGTWDWRARVISALCTHPEARDLDSMVSLTAEERVAYLKYYLDADGAALLEMGRSVLEDGTITEAALGRRVEKIFLTIWESYLTLESNPRERVRLRRSIDRLRTRPYDDRTRIHKVRPHLQPLVDFGLLRAEAMPGGIEYRAHCGADGSPLERLIHSLRDLPSMEQRLQHQEHFAIAAETLSSMLPEPRAVSRHCVLAAICGAYHEVVDAGSGLAPINAIADTSCARLLAQHGACPAPSEIRSALDGLRHERPRDVRFNVDWYGEKAYVSLSESLLSDCGG